MQQDQMSHLLHSTESEALISAVSRVNIPPQSEILRDVCTEHYRDEFPYWDFESDAVMSNQNHWDYGMRWDDDEKDICFKGNIVCPTPVFDNVVVAIHSYGHPRVGKTVDLFDSEICRLVYDLPNDRRNLSPNIAKVLGRWSRVSNYVGKAWLATRYM